MKKEIVAMVLVTMIALTACGSSESETESTEAESKSSESESGSHIYDDAEIITEEPTTAGAEKVWTYSLIEAPSDEVTDDVINDWYFNFCKPHADEYDWNIILYSDKPGMGVFEQNEMVEKDTYITQDSQGYYVNDDSGNDIQATYYWEEDGKLEVIAEAGEE